MGQNGRVALTHIHTIFKTESWREPALKLLKLGSVLCDDLEGWDGRQNRRGVEKGGDIRTYTADSLHCTAETNTTM